MLWVENQRAYPYAPNPNPPTAPSAVRLWVHALGILGYHHLPITDRLGKRRIQKSQITCVFLAHSTIYSHKHENISVIRASDINSAGMAVSWSWEEHVWVDVAGLMSEKVLGMRVSSPSVASLSHTDRLSVLHRFNAWASVSWVSSDFVWSSPPEWQRGDTVYTNLHEGISQNLSRMCLDIKLHLVINIELQ